MRSLVPILLFTACTNGLPSVNIKRQDSAPPASDDIAPECGGDTWLLTKENWQTERVDEHFRQWWDKNKDSPLGLMKTFSNEFLSQTGGMRCDLDNWCSPPACTNVQDVETTNGTAVADDGKPVKWAFFVAQAMVNLNNWMYVQHNAWNIAQTMENSLTASFVQQFTSATDTFPKPKQTVDIILQVLALGLSIVASVQPAAAPVAGVLGAVVGGFRGINGFIEGNKKQPPSTADRQLDRISQVGSYVATFCQDIRSVLSDVNVALLEGQVVGGSDLPKLFEGGTFMYWAPGQGETLKRAYQKILSAKVINQMYMLDRNFIAKVPAVNGDCNSDARYSADLKYCDPEDNGNVYYYRGYREPKRHFSDAYGWDALPQLGFSIKDIMHSSVEVFKAGGNSFIFQNETEISQQILSKNTKAGNSEAALPFGTFTIPICAADDDSIIGPYLKKKTNYPCTCNGDPKWSKNERIFKGDGPHQDKPQTRLFWHLTGFDQNDYAEKKGGWNDLWDSCKKRDPFVHMVDDIDKVDFTPMWPNAPGSFGHEGVVVVTRRDQKSGHEMTLRGALSNLYNR